MARMKRIALLFALLFALLPLPLSTLRASAAEETRYAVAADTNVWFYAGESEERRLFLIPHTYYVRVLHEGEVYTAVEYLVDRAPYRKVMGYCRTDALTFVNFVPVRPYLFKEVTVSYRLPDGGGLSSESFADIERTFLYYGSRYEMGQLYYYVLYGDEFGYIPATQEPEFDKNTDYLTVPDETPAGGETEPPAESPSPSGPSVLQIVLICAVCAVAVGVAALVLRGKRHAPPPDEADF